MLVPQLGIGLRAFAPVRAEGSRSTNGPRLTCMVSGSGAFYRDNYYPRSLFYLYLEVYGSHKSGSQYPETM